MASVRPSRRVERAGVNALRTLLEDHEHIVQEIDGGNDHGEDMHVLLTRNGRRTGHVVAIQVKSGKKYKRANGYAIPVEDHYHDWKESRIPVLGVVHDMESGRLFWVNLTRRLNLPGEAPKWVQIPADSELATESIRGFVAEIEMYIDSEGMRIRGATKEETFAGAAQARLGKYEPRSTDVANPLYEGMAEIALRHEDKIKRFAREYLRIIPLLILVGIMIFEYPYQVRFVNNYGSGVPPTPWIMGLYSFIFYMALTLFFEFRAGRLPANTGRFFGLIVSNFLWLPLIDDGKSESWWGTTWIIAGALVPSLGLKLLFASYIRAAMDRRRAAKARTPER
ncbi:DUF4365 domain-containing protein [Kitasatospora sp. NPDC086791]|uniref:DUF4365 domain-containing protein n=2 Tax=unclassified Kitasatospora TaxID=2633591 RepID=UPI00341DD7EA